MYKNTGSGIVDLAKKDIACLLKEDGFSCQCGKRHRTDLKEVIIKSNALEEVPLVAKKHGGFNTFLIADKNTFSVAGKKVANLLNSHGIGICNFVFEEDLVEPTDLSLERVLAKYEIESDLVIGVGSGTINDIGKLVAKVKNVRYINVATAPSMDGFVSDTSSMVMKGVKTTVPSSTPTAIVADLDILQDAPKELIQAGFGDIMAKYTSICEWRISNIITGEYYCEEIASLMRLAVRNCVLQTEGLRNRDAKAIQNLMESLILSGIAMSFAGITRPASGIEHYFSHVWDMRALEFGTPKNFHGIQCGIGTLLSLGIYESIKRIQPQGQRALQYVRRFNFAEWSSFLREFLGEAANGLLELETKEGKSLALHKHF